MENKRIFIHIGYPKTATTTLQNHLFSKYKEIDYLHDQDLGELSQIIFFGRENAILRNKKYIHGKLEEILSRFADSENDIVLSSESLTSFSMFFRFTPSPFVWAPDPNQIAHKLHMIFTESKLFKKIKIIISIRRQDLIIKSMYAQVYSLVYKRYKETNTFQKFLKYILDENSNHFMIDALHYEDVIQKYKNLFGKENVIIQVFEDLKHNPDRFVMNLSHSMGIDFDVAYECIKSKNVNQRSGKSDYYPSDSRNLIEILALHKKRWLGDRSLNLRHTHIFSLLQKIYVPGRRLTDITIPDRYIDKLNDEFAASNKQLSEKHGLELNDYGYFKFPYEEN